MSYPWEEVEQTAAYRRADPVTRRRIRSSFDAEQQIALQPIQPRTAPGLPTGSRVLAPLPRQELGGLPSEQTIERLATEEGIYKPALPPARARREPLFPPVRERPALSGEQPERTISGTARDISVTGMAGLAQIPRAVVGLADIPTGGRVGKFLEEQMPAGPREIQEFWASKLSPSQQYAREQVQQAEGFGPTVKAALQHPSEIVRTAAESVPLMLAGGGAGRVVAALPQLAKYAHIVAPAVGEALASTGIAAEEIRERDPEGLLSPGQSAAALGAGALTGLIGAAGARVAKKLGIVDVDALVSGTAAGSNRNILKSIIAGGVTEGVFEELPQEAQEQVWINAASGRPLTEGVSESAAQGMLAGMAMGAGVNVARIGRGRPASTVDEDVVQTVQPVQQGGLDETAQSVFDGFRNAVLTGQINPAMPEQAEEAHNRLQALATSRDPEIRKAVQANSDLFEAFGVPVQEETMVQSAMRRGMEDAAVTPVVDTETKVIDPQTNLPVTDKTQQEVFEPAPDLVPPPTIEELRQQLGEERFQKLMAESRHVTRKQTQDIIDAQKELKARQAQAETEEAGAERIEAVEPEQRLTPQDMGMPEQAVEAAAEIPVQPVSEPSTKRQPTGSQTAAGIESAFRDMGEGAQQASLLEVAKNIRDKKTERLILTRPESIAAAQANENYNTSTNDDGTVTIKGVKIDDKWVGDPPAAEPAVKPTEDLYPDKRTVETALRRGEDVPAEVMRQYPELAPAAPEQITGKEGVTKRLGSIVREEGIETKGVRRTLGQYEAKQFHEERRAPERLNRLTDDPEYQKALPNNTERIVSKAAEIKKYVNDLKASVAENKEHLVRLFEKAKTDSVTVEYDGREYTLKKPKKTADRIELTREGQDAREELLKDYQESGKLKFLADQGVEFVIQPKVSAKSSAEKYGTKTLEAAAVEHIGFLEKLGKAAEQEAAIKAKFLEEIAPNLKDGGQDHVWRNNEADTALWIRRGRAVKEFATEEDRAAFESADAELKAKPEYKKVKPGKLGTAGVSPAQAMGLRGKGSRARKAEFKAGVRAELDEALKSLAGPPLAPSQRADVRAEVRKTYGKTINRHEKAGIIQIVTPEAVTEALRKKDTGEVEIKRSEQTGRVEGLAFPDGRVWLVQDNITSGAAPGVLAHELGVHARKLGFTEEKSFQSILEQIGKLVESRKDNAINAARARVPGDTVPEAINEETLAYLISDAPQHGIIRRLVAAVKRFLAERGWFKQSLDKLSVTDLQALAQSAVRSTVPLIISEELAGEQQIARVDGPKFSVANTPEAQQARRNTENLNASSDGQTSKTSEEKGRKAIASIMEMVKAVGKKTEEELQEFRKKEQKQLNLYRKLKADPTASIGDRVKFLADFAKQPDIPVETRAKINTWIKGITGAKRPETQARRLEVALEKVETDISRRFKSKIRQQVKRAAGPKKEGAIKRGRYWYEAERDLASIREAILLTPEQVENRINSTNDRISSLEESIKTAEPGEVAGLNEKVLDERTKLQHLRTFGNLEGKDLNQLLQARYEAESIQNMGRAKIRAVQKEWSERIGKNAKWLIQEISGEEQPEIETPAERARRRRKEKKVVGRVKGAYSSVENAILSWEFVLDKITSKSGKKALQSRAVEYYGSIAHYAQRTGEQYNREATDKLRERGIEIFKAKDGKGFTKALKKFSKRTAEIRVFNKSGREIDKHVISPNEASFWYVVSKDQASAPYFKKMGFNEQSFSDIEAAMTSELKAWADFLSDEILPEIGASENEAYRAVNGTDRLKPVLDWLVEGMDEIRARDLNSVVLNRIFDANHFRAWAVPSKEFNDTFRDPTVRRFIEQHHGENTMTAIDKFLEDFAKTPKQLRGDLAALDRLRANVVSSMIGANPTTFFKQLTSFPAYAADIPTVDFVSNFIHGVYNPGRVFDMMKRSGAVQERGRAGFERDIQAAAAGTEAQMLGGAKIKSIRDVMMLSTKLGDKIAIMAGYTVYKYHYDLAMKQNKGRAEAERIGMLEFERATERTQQAGAVKDTGAFQRGGSWNKLFTMYMTAPASYTRQTMAALRHFKTDPVGSSKRLLIFNVILPMMFQAVASGFLGAGGEDEDEWVDFWQKELRAVALGPFMGIPIARDIAAGMWESAMGNWYGADIDYAPVTETGKSLTQAILHASKGLREGDEEAMKRAMNDFADFLGYMSGLPTRPARRLWEGWEDLFSGDTEHPFMAAAGYSRSARGERELAD